MSYMKDSKGKRLDSIEVETLRNRTIVLLGDSITESNGGWPGTTNTSYNSNGFFNWGHVFLGHPFQVLKNAGVAGEETTQMLARLKTDVLDLKPGWCHVLAGTNDVGHAIPNATAKANLASIYDQLTAAGIKIIAGTLPPRNTYTGTMLNDLHDLNLWIKNQGRIRKNFIVVDYYSAVAGPNGGWANNGDVGQVLTTDGTHPGNAGAGRMGMALYNTLKVLLPPTSPPFSSEQDPINILPYSRFTQGTVGSGTPPTGWNQSGLTGGPIVFSRVARTDIPGNWIQMVMPAGSKVNLQNPNALLSSGKFSIGDNVVGTIEFQRSGIDTAAAASTSGISLAVVAVTANVASPSDLYWVSGAYDNQTFIDHSGILRTPTFTVPANTTALLLQVTLGGGQTVKLDRAGIVNLTRSGAVA